MKKFIFTSLAIILNILFILGEINISANAMEDNTREILEKKDNKINNRIEVENFIDDFFKENMEKYSIPGAAIVIVKDNKEIFKKGYGYQNINTNELVDPDKTNFPAASVSKLFTATAIMKLYEEGKLDINADINEYIKPFKVENKYDEAVTCANLLTHSSGLDEQSELNCSTTDINDIKSPQYYMMTHKAKVITKPNTICKYCNQGYNILGYIIEKVSNMSYEDYVKENILKPLKMNKSNIRIDDSNTAKAYDSSDGKFIERSLPYQYTSGSSGIIATVTDMENFMNCNLNDGKYKNSRILNKETLKLMHDKQFGNSKESAGMGYGFIRDNKNGQEILKHEGALGCGYTTTMMLLPNEKLGIYIATNSLNPLPFNFENKFMDYFYSENSKSAQQVSTNYKNNKDLSKYEGSYRSYDGVSKTNIMKMDILFDKSLDMEIHSNDDGTLTLEEYTQAKEKRSTILIEEDDGIFKEKDGQESVTFRLDDNGKVIYAFNNISENSYEKITLFEKYNVLIGLTSICIISFIINIYFWIRRSIKRKRTIEVSESKKCTFKLMFVSFVTNVFNILGFIGTIVIVFMMINSNSMELVKLLYFSLSCLLVATIITLYYICAVIYCLLKKKIKNKDIVYLGYLAVINIIFINIISYCNLLGFKL